MDNAVAGGAGGTSSEVELPIEVQSQIELSKKKPLYHIDGRFVLGKCYRGRYGPLGYFVGSYSANVEVGGGSTESVTVYAFLKKSRFGYWELSEEYFDKASIVPDSCPDPLASSAADPGAGAAAATAAPAAAARPSVLKKNGVTYVNRRAKSRRTNRKRGSRRRKH